MEYIALDVHKRYTWARVENSHGDRVTEQRVLHQRGAIQAFMQQWTAGSPVAVETVGNWYWVVDEIEAGGGQPQLVNARLAKLMSGSVNKSDRLDAKGLNRLQRAGTLPTVWIPSGVVRDARELPRTRMVFSGQRTQLKNRVLSTVGKYGLVIEGVSDAFGKRGRQLLSTLVPQLPPQPQQAVTCLLTQLDQVEATLLLLERQMRAVFAPCPRRPGSRRCRGWALSWPSSSGRRSGRWRASLAPRRWPVTAGWCRVSTRVAARCALVRSAAM